MIGSSKYITLGKSTQLQTGALESFLPDPRVHLIFGCRISVPWEIRCLERSLISVESFFVVEMLPNCEEKHSFPYSAEKETKKKFFFKGTYLMLAYYFAKKEIIFSSGSEQTSAILFSFLPKWKKNWHIETFFGNHIGHLELVWSILAYQKIQK